MSIKKSGNVVDSGVLYVVATPIGNLQDISRRAIEVLSGVSVIAAEDTRHSQKLLAHLGIQTPLQACHEHNEQQVGEKFMARLHDGESIALISDAGTPLISDPGYRLIALAHQQGVRVVPVPGACAAIAALSAAGLATDRFVFEGFPPAKPAARRDYFARLRDEPRTLLFYVACHRLLSTLEDMREELGGSRRVTLARELTKTFETIHRTTLDALYDYVAGDDNQTRGEMVLVVEGNVQPRTDAGQEKAVLTILLAELPVRQAVKLAVKLTGGNKNTLYKLALAMKGDAGD